jgi:hypothetical protein
VAEGGLVAVVLDADVAGDRAAPVISTPFRKISSS